jgi:hypothetical protein
MKSFFAKVSEVRSGLTLLAEGFANQTMSNRGPHAGNVADLQPIIEMAERFDHPLWWSVEEDTGEVADVSVPVKGYVADILETETGFEIVLEPSQALRRLNRANPHMSDLLSQLRAARKSGSAVLVAETEDHEIKDVGEVQGDARPFEGSIQMLTEGQLAREVAPPLSLERVTQLFGLVERADCGPQPSGTVCIPFMYPDDGCWARAHEMHKILASQGAPPRKAWLYGQLQVRTKNNPNCSVSWRYHVAPTLPVENLGDHVLDPSMFRAPVPVTQWVSAQGGSMSALKPTEGTVFYRPESGTGLQYDINYTATRDALNTYRLKLAERSSRFGPPPYNCP